MTVRIPLYGSRDLVELRMVMVNDQEQLHIGSPVHEQKSAAAGAEKVNA